MFFSLGRANVWPILTTTLFQYSCLEGRILRRQDEWKCSQSPEPFLAFRRQPFVEIQRLESKKISNSAQKMRICLSSGLLNDRLVTGLSVFS